MMDASSSKYDMLKDVVERFHAYASTPTLEATLKVARREFITLRGDLFDSDADYEARLGVFLDWFVCDRLVRVSDELRSPAGHYIEAHFSSLDPDELALAEAFRDGCLRLLRYRKSLKSGAGVFEDIVLGVKITIENASEVFIALEKGQLVEARVLDYLGAFLVSPFWLPRPRDAHKIIVKSSKVLRSSFRDLNLNNLEDRSDLLRFLHRIACLSNRSNRYPHVEVSEIFKELPDSPLV